MANVDETLVNHRAVGHYTNNPLTNNDKHHYIIYHIILLQVFVTQPCWRLIGQFSSHLCLYLGPCPAGDPV